MFNKVKRVMTVVFIIFLLFMFTVPPACLNRGCEELLDLIQSAETADDPAGPLEALYLAYEEKSPVFRLFLNHTAVDAVGAAIAAARPLRDREAVLSAMNTVRSALEDMRRIEQFGFEGLL